MNGSIIQIIRMSVIPFDSSILLPVTRPKNWVYMGRQTIWKATISNRHYHVNDEMLFLFRANTNHSIMSWEVKKFLAIASVYCYRWNSGRIEENCFMKLAKICFIRTKRSIFAWKSIFLRVRLANRWSMDSEFPFWRLESPRRKDRA